MKQYMLKAISRKKQEKGKNHAGRLRRSGIIPANIISAGKSSSLSLVEKDFTTLINDGLRSSSLIDLNVDEAGGSQVVVKEVQRDPINGKLLHIDFYQVTKAKLLTVKIDIVPVGSAKGIKAGGALEHYIRSLKIRATPEALQESIELDISELEVGQAILFKDMQLPLLGK